MRNGIWTTHPARERYRGNGKGESYEGQNEGHRVFSERGESGDGGRGKRTTVEIQTESST